MRAHNWRCPYGELDVVAEQDGEIVFVEVKTRRGTDLGAPEEAITAGKRAHLIAAARAYLMAEGLEDRPTVETCWPWNWLSQACFVACVTSPAASGE